MKTVKEVQDFIDTVIDDDFVLRNYRITSIIDRIANFVGENNLSESLELEQTSYGEKYYADVTIRLSDGILTYRIEQTGGDGIYATYIR